MFDKLKNLFKKPEVIPEVKKEKKPRKPKQKKVEPQLTEKEKATQAGEPYVNILRMEIDPNDINSGSVELDFNDKFVLNVKGYTLMHQNNPSIFQTQYSLIFPYHITDVGVIPIWSKSYTRLRTIFKENIENSSYKTDKRKKLGLD